MLEAATMAHENWQWQSCKRGMIFRNTQIPGSKRGRTKIDNGQPFCIKTCFWFNRGVCIYSNITNHLCTKKEQDLYYMARKSRLINARIAQSIC
jgi:hypothetical protein